MSGPILDRLMAEEPRLIAAAITDINGYLPTHISERSQPQSDDPEWNAEYCRNRRNFLDDITRRAIASDKEAMLATYAMDLGQGRYLPVKNVFVPLWISGRRWGNFELAYRDEACDARQLRPHRSQSARGRLTSATSTNEMIISRYQATELGDRHHRPAVALARGRSRPATACRYSRRTR